jgi:hypothetical protein
MFTNRRTTWKVACFKAVALFLLSLAGTGWAGTCGNAVCERGENAKKCPADCGGGGDGGNDSGTDLSLSCLLLDEAGDTVMSDGGGAYVDADGKVKCSTGGTSQPNLSGIGLDAAAKGKFRPGDRFIDLVFNECGDSDCYVNIGDSDGDGTLDDGLPAGMFEADQNVGDPLWIAVRPYRDGQDHVQKLPVGDYRMAVRFNLKHGNGEPRVVINLASRDIPDDKFQGTLCNLGADTGDTLATDALVIVGAGPEDRFIVTTVDGVPTDEDGEESDGGFMKAALCSDLSPSGNGFCESGLCNFHGFVNVRFTLAADVLP